MEEQKPIGEVTHYFNKLEVAIVKFNKSVSVGDSVQFKGATTDFTHKIDSMQVDHEEADKAKKGQEVHRERSPGQIFQFPGRGFREPAHEQAQLPGKQPLYYDQTDEKEECSDPGGARPGSQGFKGRFVGL